MPSPSLEVRHISKRYGKVQALSDVSAQFFPGEIHAVLGENGAGKSTLMGVLAGLIRPDSGEILPARRAVEMVHQHFMLVPSFTVAENLALPRIGNLLRSINATELADKSLSIGRQLGWDLDPVARTGTLPVGVQQRIEILKAVAGEGQILIFDEPTAVLTAAEVLDVFRVLKDLRDQGKTIILIAHKLSEVMRIADRVTVLRKGRLVASDLRGNVDEATLTGWMVGEMPPGLTHQEGELYEVGINAKNLSVLGDRREESVRSVSFKVRRGEILGIGGVDGNGQVELAECLAGIRPLAGGSLTQLGSSIAYIPQDRQRDGLALSMSLLDNFLVEGYRRKDLTTGPFLKIRSASEWARNLIARFEIKASSINDAVSTLSGGNQQKIVVARTLDVVPDILVAVNPTRGLDIRATDYVQSQIIDAASRGTAVALFSTDLDELQSLSTNILYMSRGQLGEGGANALVGGSQ